MHNEKANLPHAQITLLARFTVSVVRSSALLYFLIFTNIQWRLKEHLHINLLRFLGLYLQANDRRTFTANKDCSSEKDIEFEFCVK